MNVVRVARRLGLRIEIADLGNWGVSNLFSEYDALERTIRINARCIGMLRGAPRRRFIVEAVAHELYHHLERIGAVERLRDHTEREAAAAGFAGTLYA